MVVRFKLSSPSMSPICNRKSTLSITGHIPNLNRTYKPEICYTVFNDLNLTVQSYWFRKIWNPQLNFQYMHFDYCNYNFSLENSMTSLILPFIILIQRMTDRWWTISNQKNLQKLLTWANHKENYFQCMKYLYFNSYLMSIFTSEILNKNSDSF